MELAGGAAVAVHAVHAAVVAVGAGVVGALLIAPARQAAGAASRVADLRAVAARGELVDLAVRRAAAAQVPAAPRPAVVAVAAVASVGAAAVHAAVAPEHLDGSLLAGAFFLVVAAAQVGWAGALLRSGARGRGLLLTGALGSLALVALWAVSRTLGLPESLGGEGVEPVGAADLLAVSCELAVVLAAARASRGSR